MRKLFTIMATTAVGIALVGGPAAADADQHNRPEAPIAIWTATCVDFRCDFTAHDLISDGEDNVEVQWSYTYDWTFGNGSATSGDTSGSVYVTYAGPGYYSVHLDGRDRLRNRTSWFFEVCLNADGTGPLC